ncbi:MAG: hypothetical protein H6687_02625 [Bacillales bacterium]|nr:hypothetical protein [Bacillales bacterium]
MEIDRDTAMIFWKKTYGNKKYVMDCFGSWIYKEDYEDYETTRIRPGSDKLAKAYGWDINYIRPESAFKEETDIDLKNNFEPMHFLNIQEKGESYPDFAVASNTYTIIRCDMCSAYGRKGYGISDSAGKRIDIKGKRRKCYTQ